MNFSMIRPRPPAVKPEPPPPPPPVVEEPPAPANPPPAEIEAPPPPPPPHYQFMGPYIEELERVSHMHGVKSVEYTNARTWRVNFGSHSDQYYYDYPTYNYNSSGSRQPSRYMVAPPHSHDHMLPPAPPRLSLPPPHHHHGLPGPPPRLALPPPQNHHALPGPEPMLALPPPDYHHYPPPPYFHPHPGYGYFSDENPNGCSVM